MIHFLKQSFVKVLAFRKVFKVLNTVPKGKMLVGL